MLCEKPTRLYTDQLCKLRKSEALLWQLLPVNCSSFQNEHLSSLRTECHQDPSDIRLQCRRYTMCSHFSSPPLPETMALGFL
ncbi:hypothetical protein Tco_0496952 [Tanacetum coccineum]